MSTKVTAKPIGDKTPEVGDFVLRNGDPYLIAEVGNQIALINLDGVAIEIETVYEDDNVNRVIKQMVDDAEVLTRVKIKYS